CAESIGGGDGMRDLGAVNDVLARQAGDVGTGAADVALLDDDHPLAGFAEAPGDGFARLAAAENNGVVSFRAHRAPADDASKLGQASPLTASARPGKLIRRRAAAARRAAPSAPGGRRDSPARDRRRDR